MLTVAVIVLAFANVCWLILFLRVYKEVAELKGVDDAPTIIQLGKAISMNAQSISDLARAAKSHLADHALERSANARPQ